MLSPGGRWCGAVVQAPSPHRPAAAECGATSETLSPLVPHRRAQCWQGERLPAPWHVPLSCTIPSTFTAHVLPTVARAKPNSARRDPPTPAPGRAPWRVAWGEWGCPRQQHTRAGGCVGGGDTPPPPPALLCSFPLQRGWSGLGGGVSLGSPRGPGAWESGNAWRRGRELPLPVGREPPPRPSPHGGGVGVLLDVSCVYGPGKQRPQSILLPSPPHNLLLSYEFNAGET